MDIEPAPTGRNAAPSGPESGQAESSTEGTIHTIKQSCRRCYSCVRECPAKAIRILDGQAYVVKERCIACGSCTVVCSQNAKAYRSGIETTTELLRGAAPVAALLAPSFPADFPDLAPGQLTAALKRAGFRFVVEVAFGADLVGRAYQQYLPRFPDGVRIATTCPAVVEYVRKCNPDLVDRLVPVVSPMIATAQAVRAVYGDDVRCVFLGPCIAKKLEARDPLLPRVVDEVLTFQEVRKLLHLEKTDAATLSPVGFDPPEAGVGRAFALTGGLMKSAGIERNLLNPDILTVCGQNETVEVLGSLQPDVSPGAPLFIEAMMCRGCFSGPGMQSSDSRQVRKKRMIQYVNACVGVSASAPAVSERLEKLDLSRRFERDDQRLEEPNEPEIRSILAHTNKFSSEDELNCGACGYSTCRAKAVAVYRGMAEEAMCLPFMIEQAERVCHELKVPWQDLREIHRHLINTEKLASLGQMAAGVAHELNNPLGTILLYTDLLSRKLRDRQDLSHDLGLLVDESQRCKKIIGMLLDFARQNRVRLERSDVGELVRRAVEESSYAQDAAGRAVQIECQLPDALLEADLDRDQMGQVLVNLVKNALEAMDGRQGVVRVVAEDLPDKGRVRVSVSDQGCGIPLEARDKVFQPFFTTKSLGKGTGLGLPISYGIVKMHRGSIWFDSEVDRGTTFHIELPKTQSMAQRSMIQ
jgi:signal transduction histidine kinase/iron only hydrogenase large subunit-like protein